jgi:hypothetical protein
MFFGGFPVLAPQSVWGAIFISRGAGGASPAQLGSGDCPHIKYRFASRFPPVISRRDREILPSRDEGNMGR